MLGVEDARLHVFVVEVVLAHVRHVARRLDVAGSLRVRRCVEFQRHLPRLLDLLLELREVGRRHGAVREQRNELVLLHRLELGERRLLAVVVLAAVRFAVRPLRQCARHRRRIRRRRRATICRDALTLQRLRDPGRIVAVTLRRHDAAARAVAVADRDAGRADVRHRCDRHRRQHDPRRRHRHEAPDGVLCRRDALERRHAEPGEDRDACHGEADRRQQMAGVTQTQQRLFGRAVIVAVRIDRQADEDHQHARHRHREPRRCFGEPRDVRAARGAFGRGRRIRKSIDARHPLLLAYPTGRSRAVGLPRVVDSHAPSSRTATAAASGTTRSCLRTPLGTCPHRVRRRGRTPGTPPCSRAHRRAA